MDVSRAWLRDEGLPDGLVRVNQGSAGRARPQGSFSADEIGFTCGYSGCGLLQQWRRPAKGREWYITRRALTAVNAMQRTVPPHITASVPINDDESGLHHDFEVWPEKLAPHAPIEQ